MVYGYGYDTVCGTVSHTISYTYHILKVLFAHPRYVGEDN